MGAVLLYAATRRFDPRAVGLVALVFDACAIGAYATIYSYEYGSPTRWALIFVVVEAALRYGLFGAVIVPVLFFPFLVFAEWWRVHHFPSAVGFIWDRVTFPFGVFLITGSIVGWLVNRLAREAALAEARAREAELKVEIANRQVLVHMLVGEFFSQRAAACGQNRNQSPADLFVKKTSAFAIHIKPTQQPFEFLLPEFFELFRG